MSKEIKFYRQHGNTCAIACLLMILEYYEVIPKACTYYESQYYYLYRSNYVEGVHFSALALHLAKNNFDVKLLHSEENIFNNESKYMSNYIYTECLREYKYFMNKAIEKGAKVKNGINIDVDLLKKYLREGNFIILAGDNDTCLHAILLTDYTDEDFTVYDPLCDDKKIRKIKDIEKFMNTPIGKWFIAVKKKEN